MILGKTIEQLDDAALLGELFMPRLNVAHFTNDPQYRERIERSVKEHRVGGFCVFEGAIETICSTVKSLQSLALQTHGIPLLFSADFEYGLPMRLMEGGTEFPDAMALGRTGDVMLTKSVAQAIAREMQLLGIGWNFAPVADVNSNPKNPIINTRSFGEDPEFVSVYVRAYLEGLQTEGIAATAKHFPGHGDTYQDSHQELPSVSMNLERFNALEGVPFREAIDAGVETILTAHIAAPNLQKDLTGIPSQEPASLSKPVLTELLRNRMGFKGVIVSDAMEMHAITKHYSDAEACQKAFEAGTDVILLPVDPDASYEALLAKLKKGEIDKKKVQESVERIFKLKRMVQVPIDPDPAIFHKALDKFSHNDLSREAATRALQIRNAPKAFAENAAFLIVCDDREIALKKAREFASNLLASGLATNAKVITPHELEGEQLYEASEVVLVTLHRARGYIGGELQKNQHAFPIALETFELKLKQAGRQLAGMILVGSPYLDKVMEPVNSGFILKTFSESRVSMQAVISKLKEWSD